MNYEDRSPSLVSQLRQAEIPLASAIEADETTVVMVLRDPYNNLASKRQANPDRDRQSLQAELETWKAHAREFLGLTDHLRIDVRISYNDWFSNAAYRAELALRLETDYPADAPSATSALNSVPNVGQSTFDRRSFNGRAQDMDVLNRWKRQLHDSDYLALFRDEETIELANRIFRIDGVDELLRIAHRHDKVDERLQTSVSSHGA